MLEHFRTFAQKKIVKWLFALFLIVPFGLFGIDFYFRSPVGGDVIASVGSQRIGTLEFDQALRQQGDVYRQQFKGQFDASLMDSLEVRGMVLDRLVGERLVALGAERSGVRIGDQQLAERIASEPFFQADGRFSKERYEFVAKAQGLTPTALDERLRQDYRTQQFRGAIADTAFVPRTTLDSFIKLSEYVEMSLDAMAARATMSPDEVKKVYEKEVEAGKHGEPEQRRISHILVAVKPDAKEADKKAAEARAAEIAARVRKSPATFEAVAKKESQDPGSAASGGDLGMVGRGAMVKAFEAAAFAARKNEIVGPVATEFGYHVLRVTEIKPAKVKPLSEVGPQIEANLKKQAAAGGYAEAAEAFSNLVYEQSTSLKPAADKAKLPIQQSPWITKGAGPTPALNNPKLQAEIFSDSAIKAQRNTAAIEVAANVLIAARVIEHKLAELQPLDGVRAGIERRLQRDEATKLARADGEAKLKEVQAGKDAGLKWPAPLAINRQKPGGLPPQVIDRVFRVDAKKLPAYAGIEAPAGYALVKVSKVIELEKVADAQREQLGARLREAVAAEELDSTLASLRGRIGVTVRKDALDKKPAN